MEDKAKLSSWESLYASNEDFRAVFDQMHSAVEELPAHLIDRGRQLNFPQLHLACVAGDLELVKGLLATGIPADTYPCTEDEDDEPALVWLAKDVGMEPKIKIQVATLLLANGADVDEGGALDVAEEMGEESFAQFLRKAGATHS